MKIPRDAGGEELAKLLAKVGYKITRQTGSHLRLTTYEKGEHHITIPAHASLKIGTLNGILKDVATHLEISKEELIDMLWK
ncbi:TPA: type II toxin-antitoxin system HicA family toxin [archaeon]|nr:type II toxin-antitoxin system HicA family toxin [Candidatus Naiadarchaeales archaeon SRR2090153.bin461]HIK02357.1 type II toxin-antitoxin system HicA family toxin [Candidatus Naiadarchaeales archaeon SRR2090159.bin1288]